MPHTFCDIVSVLPRRMVQDRMLQLGPVLVWRDGELPSSVLRRLGRPAAMATAEDWQEQYNVSMVGMEKHEIGREALFEVRVETPMMQSTTIMNEARPND